MRSRWSLLVLPALVAGALATPAAAADDPPQRWLRAGDRPLVETLRSNVEAGTVVPRLYRAPGGGTTPRVTREVQRSSWTVRYTGTFTTEQKATFEAAVDVWESIIGSSVPITVDAAFADLGDPDVLGAAGPGSFFVADEDGRVDPSDTAYPVALANALFGEGDLDPGNADIDAQFNNAAKGVNYGTDQPAAGEVDFFTIVLHELGHGLGFLGLMDVFRGSDGQLRGTYGLSATEPVPGIWDRYTIRSNRTVAEQPLLSLPRGSVALGSALRSGELYWDGVLGKSALNGRRPKLYAPREFDVASSYSHLDESEFPPGDRNSLMTPFIGNNEVVRDPGPVALGILADMGYDVPRPLLPGTRYTPLDPVRVLDTRSGLGTARAPVGAAGVVDLQVTGRNGVPSDARAVVLNVTAESASTATDVRVYPTPRSGTAHPAVSNLNLTAGQRRANLVTVPVGSGGRVRLRNNAGTVQLFADVAGFYAQGAPSTYVPVEPVRLLDTRGTEEQPGQPLGPGETRDLTVFGGPRSVPATATAVVLGVTAVDATASTDLRVYPRPADDTAAPPEVSTTNARPGPPVAAVAVVKVGRDGQVRVRNQSGTLHVLLDLQGWYEPSSNGSLFHVLGPERYLDTRRTSDRTLGPGEVRDLQIADGPVVPLTATAVVLNLTGVAATRATDLRVYPRPASSLVPEVSNLNLGPGQTAANLAFVGLGADGDVRFRNNAGEVAIVVDVAGYFGP